MISAFSRQSKKVKGGWGEEGRQFFLSDQRKDTSSSGGTSLFLILSCKRNSSHLTDQGSFTLKVLSYEHLSAGLRGQLRWSGHIMPMNKAWEVTGHTPLSG